MRRLAWLRTSLALVVIASAGGALAKPPKRPRKPKPAPVEPEKKPEPPPTAEKDLERLRAEYAELRDALFRSRARAQTLAGAMYSTKLAIGVRWKATRRYALQHASVRLDEAQIWDSGDRPLGEDGLRLAEAAVAPGRHEITLRLEVRAKDGQDLGYTSEHTFAVNVPEGKASEVTLVADDGGEAPTYEPTVKVEIKGK
jgi:hypothetical protein